MNNFPIADDASDSKRHQLRAQQTAATEIYSETSAET
jgi:hypothetical protein